MNSIPVFRFSKLSLGGGGGVGGILRTSVRLAHTSSPAPTSTQTTETQSQTPSPLEGVLETEGAQTDKIYVWANPITRQSVYSFEPQLIQRKALKQLPFNGKKTKPTKLRFDYWSQMATIELPKGTAVHTFEKLRELRQLHELCWSPKIVQDEINRRKDEEVELSKKRLLGRALCNQYGNTVADIAAVLGGVGGRSNVLVLGTEHVPKRDKEEWSDKKQPKSAASGGRRPKLLPATVRWANDSDRFYARRWTKNVRHELLPGATILRDEEFRKAHKAAQAEEEAKAELKAKREQLEKKGFKKDEWAPTKYLVKKKATETE